MRHFFPFLAVLCASSAQAQVVRGTVVDATGRTLPGVVVGLVDSTQTVVARSLTNDLGEYRVAAPRPGTYFLQTRRVGFQPGVSMPRVLTDGTVSVERLVVEGVRVTLSTVRIVGRSACGRQNSEDAGAVLAAWDQAMTSLSATALTTSSRGLTATIMQIDRVLQPGGRMVRTQNASVRTDHVTHPWRSLPPDALRRDGYTQTDASGWTTYNAPGIDALVSPMFLEDHCVKLVNSKDTSEVGLAFEPVPARRGKSEIRGTLWLERGSVQLRRLDFTYTGAPVEASEFEAGGSMAFSQIADGGIVISGWEIRMPQLVRESPRSVKVRVEAVAATGGQVVVMRRGIDTLFKRATLRVSGVVQDSASGNPIARATVSLSGTPLQVVADDGGRFAFPDVLPGEYAFRVRTPSLDSVRASSQSTVMVTDGMQALRLRVPTAAQLSGALCGNVLSGAAGRGKGAVLGSVRLAADTLPPGPMSIAADWVEIDSRAGLRRTPKRMETKSDSSGGFRLCGVPTETALAIRALPSRGRSQVVSVRLQPDERFASATLMVDQGRDAVATFTGVVVADSSGRPLADAEVAIPSLALSTRSDARGAFRLTDVPAGSHGVVVRRLGYGAMTADVTFAANDEEDRRIVLRPMTVLDSVSVTATPNDAGMLAFEENRRVGLGHFITREELDKNKGRKMGDLLAMVPGSGIVRGRTNGAWVLSKRYVVPLSGAPPGREHEIDSPIYKPSAGEKMQGIVMGCYAQVWLDNQLLNPSQPTEPFDVNSIPITQIEAVEWYASPAQTPAKYSRLNSPCGVLVIHTRRYDGR